MSVAVVSDRPLDWFSVDLWCCVLLLEVVVGEVGVSVEGVEDVVEVAPSAGVGSVVALWGVLFSVEVS